VVKKKIFQKETEPEKPKYISNRRYDLSSSDEENDKEDAKLVIKFFRDYYFFLY
jgi:hypothetical protein